MSTQHRTEGACQCFFEGKVFARTPVGGGARRRRRRPPLIGRVSPPIAFSAALINDTGRQREVSQFVVSCAFSDVYSIWELLFVWCLQSGRHSPLFWDADTWMQLATRLMRPRLPPPPPIPSVSHRVSLPLPSSSHRGRLDVSGRPRFGPWHKVPGTARCSSHRAGGEDRRPHSVKTLCGRVPEEKQPEKSSVSNSSTAEGHLEDVVFVFKLTQEVLTWWIKTSNQS